LLVDPVVIDAEMSRNNHSSISATAIERGLEIPDAKNNSQTRLGGPIDRILVVKKKLMY
jgi:hypothetical protein